MLHEVTYFTIFAFIISNLTRIVSAFENDRCGPQGSGICKSICSCELAVDMLIAGEKLDNFSICGFEKEKDPLLCCYPNREFLNIPNQPSQKLSWSISQMMCHEHFKIICGSDQHSSANCKSILLGDDNSFGGVGASVGGVLAKPRELPFMGLGGYQIENEIDWACGCSLISERYVLSAAHCTRHPTYGIARVVRLGELDYSLKNDKAWPRDYQIINYINHPQYRPQYVYYDIALYQLNETVFFSDFIRPICLPNLQSFTNVSTVFGAGWGRTDFVGPKSSALIKVNLDYLTVDQCSRTIDRTVMPRGLDEESMICAGVLRGGRDTCSGDSGGPLFLPPPNDELDNCFLYTQLGITSFGKGCALEGIPGVYTNVLSYVPWIESVVWPIKKLDPRTVWTN